MNVRIQRETEQGGRRITNERGGEVGFYRTYGLWSCRVAAGLTQKELAEAAGTNQTYVAELESWRNADFCTFRRLCEELEAAPEDLASRRGVQDPAVLEGRAWRARNGLSGGSAERRRQINRIKRRGHPGNAPGTVLLRGLKERRAASGLSQRKLAEMIGTNQATISELEKGTHRGAYMQTVRRLCAALGVSPADLICK